MMSKNQPQQQPSGGVGLRGDVSFIRATSNPSISQVPSSASAPGPQTLEQLAGQQFSSGTNPTRPPPPQPDMMPLHHHGHSHSQLSSRHSHQHSQPHLHMQQHFLPEHMEAHQYMMKQSHGAGGASGDSVRTSASHTGVEGWSDREEALAAELDEAKIRVAQMEKTMRWWSDCTSNWREKWNKARNERNKAREENRVLRSKLESVAKELSRLRREKKENAQEKEQSWEENVSLKPGKSTEKLSDLSEKEKTVLAASNEKDHESLDDLSDLGSPKSKHAGEIVDEKDVDDTEPRLSVDLSQTSEVPQLTTDIADRLTSLQEKQAHLEEELMEAQSKSSLAADNLIMMQRKLDEANNTIQSERLEKCNYLKSIEKLQSEIAQLRSKSEDTVFNLQEMTLELEKVREQHKEEMMRLASDLEEETNSRSTMDKRVTELRRELERIQAENASEWAKRERLESEKLALERDNKKLRAQVLELEEDLDKRSQVSLSMADLDMKAMQFELSEKTKELSDLRHLHGKLKKALTERSTELEHTRRRAEQYETEVRKLRARVDELKHDLASAEDEVDNQGNAARKAQRTNDELQAQVESLQVQVNHLQSRLRSNSMHGAVSTTRSTSLKSLTMEDSAELADSENDFDDI